jgi:hypothetical protein
MKKPLGNPDSKRLFHFYQMQFTVSGIELFPDGKLGGSKSVISQ